MKSIKLLTLSVFSTKSELYQARVKQYKEAFDEVLSKNTDNTELAEFITFVNGKTLSKFLSVDDMNIEKSKIYEEFIEKSTLFEFY